MSDISPFDSVEVNFDKDDDPKVKNPNQNKKPKNTFEETNIQSSDYTLTKPKRVTIKGSLING